MSVLTDIPSDKFEQEFHNGDIIELARRIDSLDITETQRRKLALIFEIARKINVAQVKEKEALNASTPYLRNHPSKTSLKPDARPSEAEAHSAISHWKHIDSSTKAGDYFRRLLATKVVEEFTVSYLNAQNKLIKTVTAFKGTVNETAVYPREIVKQAILNNAHTVILAHNHPGGSTKPSQADISTTKNIKAALDTVQIKLLDHIIVCGDSFTSLSEQGIL